MKPIKALYPLSIWLMRIGLLLFAYAEYFRTFSKFHLDDIYFYVAAVFLIAAVVIFVSGFIYKATLSVFSGLAITLVSVFNIFDRLEGGLDDTALIFNVIIAAIAIFFISNPTSR
jgi:hypothetical protein